MRKIRLQMLENAQILVYNEFCGGVIMPVHKVGKSCYQWGKSGKVYCGKDAKKNAEKQGKAIRSTGWKEKKEK